MNKLFKLADLFSIKLSNVELKEYREESDNDSLESKVEKALADHEGHSVDLSNNDQHYGWFIWNEKEDRHEQIDLNDFEDEDDLKIIRNFVSGLDMKVKLENYD
ncbi:hypothetical protein LCGC14_0526440 [marine sediment metagenome]|uniref:Uncharacterized protein n=1 Tax=marine sediment metagenome TaxID=412755 RepID=A0A0F9S1P7_9ZZZZ